MKNRIENEKLHEAQKMEALGQLTGGIAHDFNNLLTVIMSNAEDLQEELKGERHLRQVDLMLEAALRGAALVQRLLAFARKQDLRPRFVDLDTLIDQFVRLLRHTIEEHITIEVRKAEHIPAISVDPNGLENALLNLALNSRDAMPDGGKLVIDVAEADVDQEERRELPDLTADKYVRITISDTGLGMPKEVAERAFEPFFTTKEVGRGTGLGLSMVYGFVKQSHGAIRIQSEPGRGTTMYLYLPLAAPTERRGIGPVVSEEISALRGSGNILLVEDDTLARASVNALLQKLGYAVTAVSTARDAVAVLETKPEFDLVFTDIIMPGTMNGADLVRAVHRRWPNIKTLTTSGYAKTTALERISLPIGVRFLPKPYSTRVLARTIRDILADQ